MKYGVERWNEKRENSLVYFVHMRLRQFLGDAYVTLCFHYFAYVAA